MNPSDIFSQPKDQAVVNLAKSIALTESGGNYNSVGDNGTSHGAYQWNKDHFQIAAKQYGLDPNDFSPENQNKTAYAQIYEKKKEGWTPAQIAGWWNSGKKDGWQTNVGDTTINGKTIHYDTPAYVQKVHGYYQQLSGGTENPSLTGPSNAEATTPQDATQNTAQDNTYGAIAPASPNDSPLQAGLKSTANVPSSLFNLGKSIFSAVTHPVQTLKGVANAFAGGIEEGYAALTGNDPKDNEQTQTFDALKNALRERYGSLENAQKTATNDPVGFGADVFTILEGGAGLIKATTGLDATGALDRAVSATARPVIKTGEAVGTGVGKLASKAVGFSTGSGSEAVQTAFTAGQEGGEANQAFVQAMRGETTPENLVDKARNALNEISQQRQDNYTKMLSSLKTDESAIDIAPLKNKLDELLNNFNIAKPGEGSTDTSLGFDRSKFALDSEAQKDIQKVFDYINKYGSKEGDLTPVGIDNLKKVLSGYYSPNSDYRSFTEGLRSATRKLLNDVPGYTDAMKNYSEMSDTINDIRQSLSLGDRASVETSFNKLKNALQSNKELRQAIIEELDSATNGTIKESIAGQNMNSITPKGLRKYADMAGLAKVASGGVGFLPLLGLAMTTSPRIVGEIIHTLGVGARKTAQIMKYLNKFTPSVTPSISVLNTTSSISQTNP